MINKEYVINGIGCDDVYLYQDIKDIIDELDIRTNCKDDDFVMLGIEIDTNIGETRIVVNEVGKRRYNPEELYKFYQFLMKEDKPDHIKCAEITYQAIDEFRRALTIFTMFDDKFESELGTAITANCQLAISYLELIIRDDKTKSLFWYKATYNCLCVLRDLFRDFRKYLDTEAVKND